MSQAIIELRQKRICRVGWGASERIVESDGTAGGASVKGNKPGYKARVRTANPTRVAMEPVTEKEKH